MPSRALTIGVAARGVAVAVARGVVVAVAVAAAGLLLAACGSDESDRPPVAGDGMEHVHGLGVNPADGALYIATHSGVFRSRGEAGAAERVGEGLQDTMGFTVVGPDRFLASGHPAPGEGGPPHLGLIESTDGGETWEEVSLGGEADFHALLAAHDRVYGYDATGGMVMVSEDGGRSWERRRPPAGVIDLAVDPTDPERIVASTEVGLAVSEGRRWRPLDRNRIGMLAWPTEDRLYLVDIEGTVQVSRDGGERWSTVGSIGDQPAALAAESGRELHAALADATILRSTDAGATWEVRLSP